MKRIDKINLTLKIVSVLTDWIIEHKPKKKNQAIYCPVCKGYLIGGVLYKGELSAIEEMNGIKITKIEIKTCPVCENECKKLAVEINTWQADKPESQNAKTA